MSSLLAEVMTAAGIEVGLPPALAKHLAEATVSGAGALVAESDDPPSQLRVNVTSKGGTTAAALAVLMGRRRHGTVAGKGHPCSARQVCRTGRLNRQMASCRCLTCMPFPPISLMMQTDWRVSE